MKKSKLFYIIIILCFSFQMSSAAVKFEIEPGVSYMFGQSEYTLDLSQQFLDTSLVIVTERVTSLLEFPLNVFMTGMTIHLTEVGEKSRWQLSGSIETNLVDPSKKMIDSDWLGIEPYLPYTKFSYTESEAAMRLWRLDANFALGLYQTKKYGLSMILGGRYNYFKQNITGYEGWQREIDLDNFEFLESVSISGTEAAIDYTLKVLQPYFGVKSTLSNEKVEGNLVTVFAPVFFKDIDDHLIRNKISEADGNGSGVIVRGDVKFRLQNQKSTYFKLTFDFNYYKADGTQSQTWYEDEVYENPITHELIVVTPKGTSFSGIPHQVKSSTFKLGAQIGFAF